MSSQAPPRTVQLFGQDVEINTPIGTQPVWADVITELRIIDGVVSIGLGAYIVDGNGPARVEVQSRIRVPLSLIGDLDRGINQIIDQLEQAKKASN